MWSKSCILAALALAATCAGARPAIDVAPARDRFVAGGSVRHSEPTTGDLIGAGGDFELHGPVTGDAILAGGTVRIRGRVGQDLYAAGGKVILEGAIGRNARMAGGDVEVAPGASVEGNVSAAGGDVSIRGPVKGYVQAAGGDVLIDAAVAGDVMATSGQVTLGPGTRIGGKLRYRSGGELRRDPAAQVVGGIEEGDPFTSGATAPREASRGPGGGWIWTAGLLVLAALLAGAFPAATDRIAAELRSRPGLALVFGFVALVCVPVAAVILMILVIGIPVALLVLLAYAALLLLGYVAAAVALGDGVLARYQAEKRTRIAWRMLAAMLAMLAIALMARIPYLGGLVALAATLLGMGAILMALRPRAAPAA